MRSGEDRKDWADVLLPCHGAGRRRKWAVQTCGHLRMNLKERHTQTWTEPQAPEQEQMASAVTTATNVRVTQERKSA